MADAQTLANQMTHASTAAHAALDEWMNGVGNPQIVNEKVTAYKALRVEWMAVNEPVAVDNDVATPPSAPPGPEEG